jgi:hypothetical protein
MVPRDRTQLPLRWEFLPEENTRDKSIGWRWQAHTQTGKLSMQSEGLFDTFTECIEDAKAHGYAYPTRQ